MIKGKSFQEITEMYQNKENILKTHQNINSQKPLKNYDEKQNFKQPQFLPQCNKYYSRGKQNTFLDQQCKTEETVPYLCTDYKEQYTCDTILDLFINPRIKGWEAKIGEQLANLKKNNMKIKEEDKKKVRALSNTNVVNLKK